jgi:hypothetical protein
MVLLGDEAQVEARFGPFADGVSVGARQVQVCAERTIGSAIVLDVPDGTPRGRGSSGSLFWSL